MILKYSKNKRLLIQVAATNPGLVITINKKRKQNRGLFVDSNVSLYHYRSIRGHQCRFMLMT